MHWNHALNEYEQETKQGVSYYALELCINQVGN